MSMIKHRKKSCIQSIDVRTSLPLGKDIYNWAWGQLEQWRVTREPYVSPLHCGGAQKCDVQQVVDGVVTEYVRVLYLEDEGVIGYKYDDRPQRFATAPERAQVLHMAFYEWLEAKKETRKTARW